MGKDTSDQDFWSQSRQDKWDEIMGRLEEPGASKLSLSQDELDREALVTLVEVLGRNKNDNVFLDYS